MTDERAKVILHAEDELAHAEIVSAAIRLNSANVQVRQVSNGKDALDYLYHRGSYQNPGESPRPDLVLLDLRMPLVNGLEVLAVVKKDPDLQSLPVVMLTTSGAEEDKSKAHACDADDYLIKPVDFDGFVHLVKELCVTWL